MTNKDENTVQHYWKKKLVDRTLEVEYNSETDKISITFDNRLVDGTSIFREHLTIPPDAVEPLYRLLTEVVKEGTD